jgi:hypothetical protein
VSEASQDAALFLHMESSRLSHIMAPRDPNASGSVAVFGLCGIVCWRSQAMISVAPQSRVCSLCKRKQASS